MPLHVDYRAKSFDEIIGNDKQIKVLKSILNRKDRPHAYLFIGEYGCGKTTLAYLVKDYLGCDNKAFQEVNVGIDTGVKKAREIYDKIRYRPLSGSLKVILLDEFHMASSAMQNALLKDLENPPEHVYFLLCTTNPEKIVKGIKDDQRCFTFEVGPLPDPDALQLLKEIAEAENVKVPKKALDRIVELAEGIPRRLLVMLDKIISLPEDQMADHIEGSLPEEERNAIEIVQGLVKQNARWPDIVDILKDIKSNYERVRIATVNYTATVIRNKNRPESNLIAIYEAFNKPYFHAPTAKSNLLFSAANAFNSVMKRR